MHVSLNFFQGYLGLLASKAKLAYTGQVGKWKMSDVSFFVPFKAVLGEDAFTGLFKRTIGELSEEPIDNLLLGLMKNPFLERILY